jgi:hypothetical protein
LVLSLIIKILGYLNTHLKQSIIVDNFPLLSSSGEGVFEPVVLASPGGSLKEYVSRQPGNSLDALHGRVQTFVGCFADWHLF